MCPCKASVFLLDPNDLGAASNDDERVSFFVHALSHQ